MIILQGLRFFYLIDQKHARMGLKAKTCINLKKIISYLALNCWKN